MPRNPSLGLAAPFLVLLLACEPPERPAQREPDGGQQVPPPPVTQASPAGGSHVGTLVVTLTSDRAATLTWTVDGSDPVTSDTARSGPSPQTVLLEPPAQVTLRFFARDGEAVEETRSESYTLLSRTTEPSITGTVILHEALKSGQLAVAVYDHDPVPANFARAPVQYLDRAVGGITRVPYAFEGLPDGSFWLIALWWPTSARGDPQAFSFARRNPLALAATGSASRREDFVDLYLGRCDPSVRGIEGTVRLGERYANHNVGVAVLDAPFRFSGAGNALGSGGGIGKGASRPFAVCDLPAGPGWLYVSVAAAGAQEVDELVSFHENPVQVSAVHQASPAVGTRTEGLGSISGRIDLNRPLAAGETLRVVLFDEEPSATAPVLAMQALSGAPGATSFSFEFASLAAGDSYRVLAVMNPAQGDPFFAAYGSVAVKLPESPHADDVVISMTLP